MKIGSLDTKASTAAVSGESKGVRTPADKTRSNAVADESAKVEISSAGSAIADAAADPSFDAAKVDRIAQAIRDGKFEVNAEKIADKLISNAQDLVKRYSSGH